MNILTYAVLGVVLIAVGVLYFWLRRASRSASVVSSDWPFRTRPRVLSTSEQELYWRLLEALPEYFVLVDVALSRLVMPISQERSHAWYNRIRDRFVDFAVVNPEGKLVAVIELDRTNGDGTSTRARSDAVKDKVLYASNVRVLRWKAGALPEASVLARQLGPGAPTTVKPTVGRGRGPTSTVPRASRFMSNDIGRQ